MDRINAWTTYEEADIKEMDSLCADYREFLNAGKTERECVKLIVKMADEKGYRNLADIIKNKESNNL